MSSVSRAIADKVVERNGRYSTDPLCIGVIEYANIFDGGLTYKLVYKGQDIEYVQSTIACQSSRVYWRRET